MQVKRNCNILICMQKHIQHSKDEWTQFFRKIYLSLYSKGLRKVLCVRGGVGDWTELQHIDSPTLLAITAFLYRSPGLLNWTPGGSASVGTWFSFQHLLSNWSDFLSLPGYIILLRPPASCGVTICTQFNSSTVKDIPRYLRPYAPVIYTGAFLIWQLGLVGGQYVTKWLLVLTKKNDISFCEFYRSSIP